jgi:hypothetical protein
VAEVEGEPKAQPSEVREIRLVALEKAFEMLSREQDKWLLLKAAEKI